MNPPVNPGEQLLLKRTHYMMAIRVILVTLFLGLPLLLEIESIQNPRAITTFYILIGSTYALSIAYAVFLKLKGPSLHFISIQLTMDILLETILISVTGGLGSPFPFLFIITIVSAAIFFHHRGGLLMAGVSTLFFGLLAIAQRAQLPPLETALVLGAKEAFYGFFLYMIAFFTVGVLSGRLAKRLREKEIGFLDLRVFHEDIVHSMPSGLITTDLHGKITSFNRSATEITGYPPEEVIGKTWWEKFAWQDIQNHFKALADTQMSKRFEGEIRHKSGETCLLGVTISALRNDQGSQTGIIGTFQDLTEIRNLEEAVHRKERLATIGEMAAGMAHEIRNPLASLSGSIQVLQNELALSGENLKLMEIANRESERLNVFVTQFLRYARPLPPQREWLNLHNLLSETTHLIQNNPACTQRIQIMLEEAREPILAFVDPDQMKQVFWNLINNAHQAIQGIGTLTLSARRVMRRLEEDMIEILFKDTGKGIAEADLPNIFNPFFTTKSAGSGLGLAIVQRVVEEHAGEISVSSQPGETIFKIRLPFSSAAAPPMMAPDPVNASSDKNTDATSDLFEKTEKTPLTTLRK
ncbi:MAG: nitrogen regulation protein NR(II) [Nitrospiria bacterium]